MSRWFLRAPISDSVEEAIDANPGRLILHTRPGGDVVGAVELDPQRAMEALATYAEDLRRRSCELEALAEVVAGR